MENSIEANNSAENVEQSEILLKNSVVEEPKQVEVKTPSKEDTLIVSFPQRLKKNTSWTSNLEILWRFLRNSVLIFLSSTHWNKCLHL